MSSPAGDQDPKDNLKRILQLEVPVIAVIGETRMKLGDVLRLNVGSIVEIEKGADERLDLMVNDQRVGRGKPVRSGENYGLEITEIGQPQDTIRKLGERHNS